MDVWIQHADHVAPSIHKKSALTSPTSGSHSVGIVRSRTQAKELVIRDVLGRINHLLPIDTTRTSQKRNASNNSTITCVFTAVVTFLPSRWLPTLVDTHRHTGRWEGFTWRTLGGLRYHVIHTKFRKHWFVHFKVTEGGFTDTQRAWRSYKICFCFPK
jgi:hypothetical protein